MYIINRYKIDIRTFQINALEDKVFQMFKYIKHKLYK